MAQVVENLPSKNKALSSNSSTTKRKGRGENQGGGGKRQGEGQWGRVKHRETDRDTVRLFFCIAFSVLSLV
jgi:hypothetical protein